MGGNNGAILAYSASVSSNRPLTTDVIAVRQSKIQETRPSGVVPPGGGRRREDLDRAAPAVAGPDLDLLALDEALARLEQRDPRKAQLVKLRFFAGLTGEQAAADLGVSPRTADALWAYARAWLFDHLGG